MDPNLEMKVDRNIPSNVVSGPVPVDKIRLKLISNEDKVKDNKRKMIKLIIIGVVIVGCLVLIGGLIRKIDWRPGKNPAVSGEVSPTPTVKVEQTPGVIVGSELKLDTDTDGIPDAIESRLNFDPNANDCVRNAGCGDIGGSIPRAKLRLNVVFVVDVSGSMNTEVAGQNKWESAKNALSGLLSRKLPRYMDVGVVMYGHVGSSSEADKQLSCQSVEIVKSLSPLTSDEMAQILTTKSPAGWTPLAGSLQKAGEMLKDREGEANYIVVLSDGQETCGGNPVAVAESLHNSGVEVTTNVVGLALTEEEKQQLEAIAKSGGGGFFAADEPSQLERALTLSTDALLRWEELNKCIAENVIIYSQCISTHYIQAVDEVRKQKVDYQNQQSSPFGGTVDVRNYTEAENSIWQFYNTLKDDNWLKYRDDLELISPR